MDRQDQLEVLLVGGTRREPDHWSFPKGRQHAGERIEETALREIHEETGLDVELLALVAISAYQVILPGEADSRDKTVRLFLARVIGGSTADRDDERLDVCWLPVGEAHDRLKYARDRDLLLQAQAMINQTPLYKALLSDS
jgi:8-oxo-dGTP pyrophosphatase MutT (NUDIX family)